MCLKIFIDVSRIENGHHIEKEKNVYAAHCKGQKFIVWVEYDPERCHYAGENKHKWHQDIPVLLEKALRVNDVGFELWARCHSLHARHIQLFGRAKLLWCRFIDFIWLLGLQILLVGYILWLLFSHF
jgi:hypothetical protein